MKTDLLQKIINEVLSIPSAFMHTVVFIVWFIARWDLNLLTNIVSLEAIYLTIFVGVTQQTHHKGIKHHLEVTAQDDLILREIQRLHERISFINRPRLEAKEKSK